MLYSTLVQWAVLLGTAAAAPAPSGHMLHERRDLGMPDWRKIQKLPSNTLLPMRVGLTQSNLDKGHDMLMEVSDMNHENYGKHYTADQIIDFFSPSEQTIDTVRGWLESAGVAAERISLSANKQWLQFDSPADEAETLFGTEYHIFEHKDGATNIACDEYHLPSHIKSHVDYITPGIKLHTRSGLPARASKTRSIEKREKKVHRIPPKLKPVPLAVGTIASNQLGLCDVVISPDCIAALYNITKGTTAAKGNQLGIFEDLGDVYSQEDLNLFFQTLAPYIPQGTHPTLDAIDGAVAPTDVADAGPESDLDFQISYPIIYPQNSILFQTDDPVYENNYTFDGFLNNFFDGIDGSYCTFSAFGETGNSPLDPPYPDPQPGGYKGQLQCGKYKATNVISISYGGAEAGLPVSYQRRQCAEILKLGLQGTTVLVASGDYGVATFPGPDDNGCLGNGTIFAPDFPATCPYITSVGSTFLPPGGDVTKDQEVATTRFPSGGGFSNIYARAEAPWQIAAVDAYFAKNLVNYPFYSTVNNPDPTGTNNGGVYNRIGRGYPDLSAIGDNVLVYIQGGPNLIGGTSASTPAFGAILTRVNEVRLAKGKSTIGFINPTLYANPQLFNDITVGNNSGCFTPGFFATKGWDPLTGLGTPNYPAFLKVFS